MSDIKIQLSKSDEDYVYMHDYEYEYPESNNGGNSDYAILTITNNCGNPLSVAVFDRTSPEPLFHEDDNVHELRIKIQGAMEIAALRDMIDLIEKAHEVHKSIRRKHGT